MEFLVCPLYTFIIPHFRGFVKGFCEKILFFFVPLWVRFVSHIIPYYFNLLGHWFTFIYRKYEHLAVESLCRVGLTRSPCDLALRVAFPLSVFIIPHFRGFVKRFFKSFSTFFALLCEDLLCEVASPLDTIIIPQTAPKVKMAKCTNLGKIIVESLSILPIDKLLKLWYNGNFGRSTRERPTNYIIPFGFCQEVFEK